MSEDPYWNVDNMLYGKFADDVERQVYYPAVRQSWNRYAYCMGNPVRYTDKWGTVSSDDTFYLMLLYDFASHFGNVKYRKTRVDQELSDYYMQVNDASIDPTTIVKPTPVLHYENNSKLAITGYINNQKSGKASKLQLGESKYGSNTCGAVAVYNAYKKIGKKTGIEEIIWYLETNEGLILDGNLGVNPWVLDSIFNENGAYAETIFLPSNRTDDLIKDCRTAIVCYVVYTETDQRGHFINATWNSEKQAFELYNEGGDEASTVESVGDYFRDRSYTTISVTLIS